MFTGLVEGKGQVAELLQEEAGVRLKITPPESMRSADNSHPAVELGDSVAINGCCLTVVEFTDDRWDFQAGSETLSRTNLGRLQPGDPVNLERSLTAQARLGGHFVQGHVDGLGTVSRIEPEGEWVKMWFDVPAELAQLMVTKGSVTVDGISLTLVDVGDTFFSIALIPHTLEKTTLSVRGPGDPVNIETDILGKYMQKMLTPWLNRLDGK
ncbi:riboflavin synthase [Rubinisphaera brasiliensis]|uniref:Riboflavin synthase n=1 Tax=Rubinisphaera brasiliensis (strain ATCC 49424 / DSM 5305 / JCM 21570 / IAM 15109 / NBRC 103401 / IFAM 1448) TaxID=756272 RepID=F0SRR6_RUBBR|nr:riboflavin synthase [Rubinisphaera brasiliensis]ADY60232.1 riboflavin synthase, alpha subunit [Rubinisphaera brasiliensis DSM 5305]